MSIDRTTRASCRPRQAIMLVRARPVRPTDGRAFSRCALQLHAQRLAFEAYANREFGAAVDLVTQLLQRATQPADSARLYEMRAQVCAQPAVGLLPRGHRHLPAFLRSARRALRGN